MGKYVDITGQKFGRLTAIKDIGSDNRKGRVWECLCDCGEITNVSSNHLRRGHTKSCGCLKLEETIQRSYVHGHAGFNKQSTEYKSWYGMKSRCYNSNHIHFEDYGGRGIKVCERWLDSFENFLADMGNKPSPKHSIDRKDVNGDYTPENCRWATKLEQSRNQRTRKDNESGVRGVRWSNRDKMWYANIRANGKYLYLGCFKDLNKAIEARKEAEYKYWNKKPS